MNKESPLECGCGSTSDSLCPIHDIDDSLDPRSSLGTPSTPKVFPRTASLETPNLVHLIHDLIDHIDELIESNKGGLEASEHIDQVVREVLEKERFSTANREWVESESELKRFICTLLPFL